MLSLSLTAIRDALLALGLAAAEVTVTAVQVLDRQDSGKFRRFVPLPKQGVRP